MSEEALPLLDRLARVVSRPAYPTVLCDVEQYETDACNSELQRWMRAVQPPTVTCTSLSMGNNRALYRTGFIDTAGLARLAPRCLLNDDVIDWCMLEMFARSLHRTRRVHFETARLNRTLRQRNWASVLRSHNTLPYDLMLCDTIVMPENDHLHWWLWIIDLRNKRLFVLDPMGHNPMNLKSSIVAWLTMEYERRGFRDTHVSSWPCRCLQGQQDNGYDCGVFVVAYAKCIACNVPVEDIVGTVTQKRVTSMRGRILTDALALGI